MPPKLVVEGSKSMNRLQQILAVTRQYLGLPDKPLRRQRLALR